MAHWEFLAECAFPINGFDIVKGENLLIRNRILHLEQADVHQNPVKFIEIFFLRHLALIRGFVLPFKVHLDPLVELIQGHLHLGLSLLLGWGLGCCPLCLWLVL